MTILKVVLEIVALLLFVVGNTIRDWLKNTFRVSPTVVPTSPFVWKQWHLVFLLPPFVFVALYFLIATLILVLISGLETIIDQCFQFGDVSQLTIIPTKWREQNIWLTLLFFPIGLVLLVTTILLFISGLLVAVAKAAYQLSVVNLKKFAKFLWRLTNQLVDNLWLAINEMWHLTNQLLQEISNILKTVFHIP